MSNDPATAAIEYALGLGHEGLGFLELWNVGEFDIIRREFPDVPKEVFIGADPLLEEPVDRPLRSPLSIARDWYKEEDIERGLQNLENMTIVDVTSQSFARWLTEQYRLAMAKGIELGRADGKK